MVADVLAERWGLARPKERFRGRIAEGRAAGMPAMGAGGPRSGGPASGVSGERAQDKPVPALGGSGGRAQDGPVSDDGPVVRPRVAVLWPQTYMNDAGRSVGPARGALKLPLDRVLVVHDEIDIPFGEIRARVGGGLAGHNGLKSLRRELGGPDFVRVRIGVGRPHSSDPEIVSAHVLGRFREDPAQVRDLLERAADRVQRIVLGEEPV
jgi:aminoacyl-tRNA hydrolase